MMYWDFPSVSPADRLERSPALDLLKIRLSPTDAAAKAKVDPPGQLRLNTFDGRPAYRFRSGGDETIVYADTGDEQIEVSKEMVDRIASAWSGQPAAAAHAEAIEDVDQWTIQTRLRDVKPLWKYSWPDGQEVYVSQASGEILQYTTTTSRWAAYLGAIPHWLYFTPLRKRGHQWSQVVIWTSGIGTFAALLGIVIGVWMYSPSKRYRYTGTPASIPYRGPKRWHTIFGLIFGVGAVTWAFSGMLSMDPFPLQRTGEPAEGGRRGAGGIPEALRGRLRLAAFTAKPPRDALAQIPGRDVRELELVDVAGQPAYLATLAGGETRVIPVHGSPQFEFGHQQLTEIITKATRSIGFAEIRVLDQYDRYYLDRRRERPLPVILARLQDVEQTRYYIDPRTARVVGTYSSRNWIARWLYHGLHSLDFPWLYDHRPIWDIVVITFMSGGTALSVTSLILAWRVIGRKLRRALTDTPLPDIALTEDTQLETRMRSNRHQQTPARREASVDLPSASPSRAARDIHGWH
jgi:hypothetical protein